MRYLVTKLFIGGLLEGLTHTENTSVHYTPGSVCRKPIGGSPYCIVAVEVAL